MADGGTSALGAPRESEAVQDARRDLEICNACRYCEGYCAVFPAMELRREFSTGDITHLANLCHNCKGCYYACQYAPPHPFGINLPKTFAEVRQESYAAFAWPQPMARLFERNGTVVALVAALVTALVLIGTMAFRDADVLFSVQTGPGSFYRILPWGVMASLSGITFLFSLLAMGIGVRRFWRATGAGAEGPITAGPAAKATYDVLALTNLGGGGHGCNDKDGGFSQIRRWLHHSMFYGFMLCFASTSLSYIVSHFFGGISPYPFTHPVVLLGTSGGVLLAIGTGGLIWLKMIMDPDPVARKLLGAEYALLILLFLIAVTGLALLGLRHTSLMGTLLAIHLGLVLGFFITMPYSKFVHGFYRSAALLRNAIEQKRAAAH